MMMDLPKRVKVVEVGPRDGLQNEKGVVPLAAKIRFVEALADAGLPVVEAGAFVRADRVPQMADSEEVFRSVRRRAGTAYTALVPNRQGFEKAVAAGIDGIGVFTAASEAFNRKNINASVAESIDRFSEFVPDAKKKGIPVRAYVSTCWVCPYDGPVAPAAVLDVVRRLVPLSVDEISLGDTVGAAVPTDIERTVKTLLDAGIPAGMLAFHGHDTRGTALANTLAALACGVATIDSSAGGLGGCPYAPGAAGNLATEDLLYMLAGCGVETGISLDKVAAASLALAAALGKTLPSRYLAALLGNVRPGA